MLRVQLFLTCLGEQFYAEVLRAMVIVLERLGATCELPDRQVCCGQPLYNSGLQSQTVRPARQWLRAFAESDGYIVAPSGSCVEFVRHRYPELFPPGTAEHDLALSAAGRTYEFTEFLARVLKVTDTGAYFPHKVAYHASCHILRGLGLSHEPLDLLKSVRGLDLVPLPNQDTCCGFGGVFSVVYPDVSRRMLEAKVQAVADSGAEVVVVSEPGCLMNISGGLLRAGSPVRAMHLAQVMAAGGREADRV